MKKINKHSWAAITIVIGLCAVLSSFTLKPGAHSFQVYLDDKMIVDQYVTRDVVIPKLTLDPAERYNNIVVKYSECGRTVSTRVITLKDEQNKVLKEWRFEGATAGYKDPMTVKVKDLVAFKPKTSNTLKLFYSSSDFPDGQQVASLVIGKDINAAMK